RLSPGLQLGLSLIDSVLAQPFCRELFALASPRRRAAGRFFLFLDTVTNEPMLAILMRGRRGGVLQVIKVAGKRTDRRKPEEIDDVYFQAGILLQLCLDADDKQRVSTEIKEVLVNIDLLDGKDALPDTSHQPFHGRLGGGDVPLQGYTENRYR